MNNDTKRQRLDRIDDFIVDEILNSPDNEILAEVDASEIDKAVAILERAELIANKKRLAAIRLAIQSDRKGQRVVSFNRDKAREELKAILQSDSSLRGKMTLAARKGTGVGEDDAEGILDDLAELASEGDGFTDGKK